MSDFGFGYGYSENPKNMFYMGFFLKVEVFLVVKVKLALKWLKLLNSKCVWIFLNRSRHDQSDEINNKKGGSNLLS